MRKDYQDIKLLFKHQKKSISAYRISLCTSIQQTKDGEIIYKYQLK